MSPRGPQNSFNLLVGDYLPVATDRPGVSGARDGRGLASLLSMGSGRYLMLPLRRGEPDNNDRLPTSDQELVDGPVLARSLEVSDDGDPVDDTIAADVGEAHRFPRGLCGSVLRL